MPNLNDILMYYRNIKENPMMWCLYQYIYVRYDYLTFRRGMPSNADKHVRRFSDG